jgi:hypothetical protein
MDKEEIIEQLEELIRGFGIKIRYEPITFDDEITNVVGGLCKLRGEKLLIINSKSPMRDKIKTFAQALRSFDLDKIYIKPAIRALIEKVGTGKAQYGIYR